MVGSLWVVVTFSMFYRCERDSLYQISVFTFYTKLGHSLHILHCKLFLLSSLIVRDRFHIDISLFNSIKISNMYHSVSSRTSNSKIVPGTITCDWHPIIFQYKDCSLLLYWHFLFNFEWKDMASTYWPTWDLAKAFYCFVIIFFIPASRYILCLVCSRHCIADSHLSL